MVNLVIDLVKVNYDLVSVVNLQDLEVIRNKMIEDYKANLEVDVPLGVLMIVVITAIV